MPGRSSPLPRFAGPRPDEQLHSYLLAVVHIGRVGAMSWEDSDDEWEKAELNMAAGPAPASDKQEWSDEETEEDRAAAKKKAQEEKIKGTEHAPEKERELTKLEIAIAEREAREIKEAAEAKAKKKAALAAKMAGTGPSALEQELCDGGGEIGGGHDDFEWDGGRGPGLEPEIDTTGLASALPRTGGQIEEFEAIKDADFEKLAGLVAAQIQKYDGKRGQLVLLKALLKQSTANLSTDDAKQLNTLMGTIFNDKLKADREKDKGKKKPAKKGAVSQGKATGRCNDYDDDW